MRLTGFEIACSFASWLFWTIIMTCTAISALCFTAIVVVITYQLFIWVID